MTNHESRPKVEQVHLLLAFHRKKDKDQANLKCIRVVIKDYEVDLANLEHKCKLLGGSWRIHRTVNARSTEKARKWLIHKLIDHPEYAGYVDSMWKTALLQKENAAEHNFMLDVDGGDIADVIDIIKESKGIILDVYHSARGYHIIAEPFDTRKICELSYVTLLRDGYFFIKKIEG